MLDPQIRGRSSLEGAGRKPAFMPDKDHNRLSDNISGRIDVSLSKLLDDTAAHHKLSKAELIRRLLELGIEVLEQKPDYQHDKKTDEIMNGLFGNTDTAERIEAYIERVQRVKKTRDELLERLPEAQQAFRNIKRRTKQP